MPLKRESTKFHEKEFDRIPSELENIGKKIVHAAYLVHKALGPGLLEKVYEICLCHELIKLGLNVKRQVDVPIVYDGMTFQEGLRLDLLVDNEPPRSLLRGIYTLRRKREVFRRKLRGIEPNKFD